MVYEKLSGLVSAEDSVELQNQQNLYSQDLNSKIKVTAEEVVETLEKLNVQDESGKQALLSVCNCFVENVGTIIYHLQNFMINLQEKLIGKQELVKLVGKLVETSYSVQQFFHRDSNDLKLKLIKSLDDVEVAAAELLEIIEDEESIENKNKLIDELSNLLRTIECLSFHSKFLTNPNQIKQLFDESTERIQAALDSIKIDNNKIVLYHFVHAVNTGCAHMQRVVHYIERYADQFGTELYTIVMATSSELHYILVEMQELLYKSIDIKLLKDLIRRNVTRGCAILGELENFLENKEVADSFKEVVYAICSNSLASGDQLQRGLENSSRFVKMRQ